MPKTVFLLGASLALLAGALALIHELLGPWPGVNERNAKRIKKGMTLAEAEAILGGRWDTMTGDGGTRWRSYSYWWTGSDGVVIVNLFGTQDQATMECHPVVQGASFQPFARPSPLQRVRTWLGGGSP